MVTKLIPSTLGGIALICLSVCACSSRGTSTANAPATDTPTTDTPAMGAPMATLRGHKDMMMGLAFSPDRKLLASASHDGTARLWDVAKRLERNVFHVGAQDHFPLSVAFSRDSRLLAAGCSDHTVKLWNVDTGKEQATLRGHSDSVESVAFSPTTDVLASAASGEVFIWEAPTGKRIAKLETGGKYDKVAFSPDGKTLVSAGFGIAIEIWDLSTVSKQAALDDQGAIKLALAFAPDGSIIIASDNRGGVVVCDARARQLLKRITSERRSIENVLSLAVLPDSKIIALSSSKGVECFDWTNGREVGFFPVREGEKGLVTSLAVSPDGKTLAVADSENREIKLFDLAGMK